MKTRIRVPARPRSLATVIGLSCALAWAACAPAADGGADAAANESAEPVATQADVEAAFQAFVDAWEAEDLEAAVGTFTADAVAFDPIPPVKFAGYEAIRGWISGAFENLDGISITVSEVEVERRGPVAWSTARYVFEAAGEGQATSDEGYVSMVWVLQEDGSYKASLFHASNLPDETAAEAS